MVGSKALRGEAAEKSRQAVGFSGNEVDTDDESAASDDIEEEDESMSSDNGSESFDEELDQNRSEVEAEGDDDDDSNDEMGSDPGDRLHGQDINTNHHQLSSALPKPLPNAQRSEETMSTTPAISGSKYIPPSLRAKLLAQKSEGSAKESAERQQRLLKIHRQVQGQINRLSESNMEVILGEIEAIYMDNPRAEVTSALSKVLIQSIRSRVHMLDTFLYINAAFVCAIYRLIGLEVAATLVQDLMEQLESAFNEGHALYKAQEGDAPSTRSTIDNSDSTDRMQGVDSQGGVGKECANLVAFLSELYNFRVITCQLVYDVMGLCAKEINEFTAELMLKIIQVSGINLRKDDPLALKKLINDVSETLSNSNGGSKPERSPSIRCKFMVETLTNLKNNRMKRTMNTSADNVSRLMKFIGNLSKKRAGNEPINIGLKDIHDIETKGKWWLVGASWAGHEKLEDNERAKKPIVNKDSKSATETLVKLAKKHHMNTDIRKSIF
ncbi:suppressor of glycerol defect, partial [Spiromyces aspiralis]